MDFKLILLAFGLAFAGCAEIKETAEDAADSAENAWKGKHKLDVTLSSHRPYCGGAAPDPEQEQGSTTPLSGQVFYLYEGERPASVSQMVKIRTDLEGHFSIDLKTGVYSVISEDKTLSLEEFIAKHKIIDQFYSYAPDSCFEEWRNRPNLVVDLSSNESRNLTIEEDCFTGNNPCMLYTGPYPP